MNITDMKIWLYCIIRNEARILPYLLRHYEQFVDKMLFFEDHSTDCTRDLILEHSKCELYDWPGTSGVVDDEFLNFANSKWKEARGIADWVIWIDADEFLYHPKITEVLTRYINDGIDIPDIQGFTMVSDKFPEKDGQIYEEIKRGFPEEIWSKKCIFRPHVNMVYNMGRHSIDMRLVTGKTSSTRELFLLHYRCLGLEYLKSRNERNWNRVPERCRIRSLGTNCSPGFKGAYGFDWYVEMLKKEFPEII